jgi:hypothetical protein
MFLCFKTFIYHLIVFTTFSCGVLQVASCILILKQSIQTKFRILGAHCVLKTLLFVYVEKLLCFTTLICEFIELHFVHNNF